MLSVGMRGDKLHDAFRNQNRKEEPHLASHRASDFNGPMTVHRGMNKAHLCASDF
jgi:hypothetical protein